MSGPRVIVHVDLDAFFASVEVLDRPELRGQPVIVAGAPPRGVVAAASYEVRRFGVHSAMPTVRALRLCPHAVILPPRHARYVEVSDRFFEILGRYSPLVEGLSVDEAFIDLTGTRSLLGPPEVAVRKLRAEIRSELGLAASAGISPVKFASKIASDLAKPDGQLEVSAEGLLDFLSPLPVTRVFGVGPKRAEALHSVGIRTIAQLREAPFARLSRIAGNEAGWLQSLARGEDPRPVVADREAKSVGSEETFDEDLTDLPEIEAVLLEHADKVAGRLRRSGRAAGGVTLKYKLDDFRLVTRQTTLDPPTQDARVLHESASRLLRTNPPPRPIRLAGVSAHSLTDPPVRGFFDREGVRRDKLNAAIDSVRDRFGSNAITPATLLRRRGDG